MATINIDDLPSNSNKSKASNDISQGRRMEKVVQGRTRKPSTSRRIRDIFIGEDIENVGDYLVFDIIVPGIKSLIVDSIINTTEAIFGTGSRRKRPINEQTSYSAYYKSSTTQQRPGYTRASVRDQYSYNDIIVDTRGEAELILDQLLEAIDTYGSVSIGDLYDACGITGEFTDYNYGWFNLRNASVRRVRDGYILDLPQPRSLK